jgi:putative membrane protein
MPFAAFAQAKHTVSFQDRQFANMAAQANKGEIEVANVAQQKASNESVKQFAKLMIDDHTKAGEELKTWASHNKVTLPSYLSSDDSTLKSNLSSLSGSDFDKKYMQAQLEDHKKVISGFEIEIQDGKNPQLKQFAEQTLPTLQDHIRVAEDVAGHLGLSGKMGLTDQSKAVASMQAPH